MGCSNNGDSYTWDELEEGFDELMREIYSTVTICGIEYDALTVWKEHDPVAYRCALSDYVAGHYYEDEEDGAVVYYSL